MLTSAVSRGGIGQPVRDGQRVVNFVHAGVAVFPYQYAGIERDHRDQKHVERPGNDFEHPISHRETGPVEGFAGAQRQGGYAVEQSRQQNHDEGSAFDNAQKLHANRSQNWVQRETR